MGVRMKAAAVAAAVLVAATGSTALAGTGARRVAGSRVAEMAARFVESGRSARATAAVVDGDRLVTADVPRSIDEIVSSVSDWSDPVVAMDVVRAGLQLEHGIHLPDLHPETSIEADDGQIVGKYAYPTGDLDGDGMVDVATALRVDDEMTFAVFSGRNGQPMWTRTTSAADWLGIPAGDADGDGGSEIFAESFRNLDCPGCPGGESRFEWTVQVLSGATGAVLWQRSDVGRLRLTTSSQRTGSLLSSSSRTDESYEGENLFVMPSFDREGADGSPAPLFGLNRVSGAWQRSSSRQSSLTHRRESLDESSRWSATAELLESGSGSAVASLARESVGFPELRALPDMVGGSARDWLWSATAVADRSHHCEQELPVTGLHPEECSDDRDPLRIYWSGTLVDGDSLEAAWDEEIDLNAIAHSESVPDVDGDGRADLMVADLKHTHVVAGSTGQPLWTSDAHVAFGLGDLDGDHDADVADMAIKSAGGRLIATIRRRDARTGEVILTTVHERSRADHDVSGIGVVHLPNSGGSPAGDFVVQFWGGGSSGEPVHEFVADDGATGEVFYREVKPGLAFTTTAGDVDGDGINDALVLGYPDEGYEVSARRLTDGSEYFRVLSSAYPWAWLVEDHDGEAGVEVLTSFGFGAGEGRVDLLRGRTGERLWSIVSAEGPSPWQPESS